MFKPSIVGQIRLGLHLNMPSDALPDVCYVCIGLIVDGVVADGGPIIPLLIANLLDLGVEPITGNCGFTDSGRFRILWPLVGRAEEVDFRDREGILRLPSLDGLFESLANPTQDALFFLCHFNTS